MPATTRMAARQKRQHLAEPLESRGYDYDSPVSSDDEDDDGIPAVTPSASKTVGLTSYGPSLRPFMGRSHVDDDLGQSRVSKRQKTKESSGQALLNRSAKPTSGGSQMYTTPDTPPPSAPVADVPLPQTRASSVDVDMVNKVNASLLGRRNPGSQKATRPAQQEVESEPSRDAVQREHVVSTLAMRSTEELGVEEQSERLESEKPESESLGHRQGSPEFHRGAVNEERPGTTSPELHVAAEQIDNGIGPRTTKSNSTYLHSEIVSQAQNGAIVLQPGNTLPAANIWDISESRDVESDAHRNRGHDREERPQSITGSTSHSPDENLDIEERQDPTYQEPGQQDAVDEDPGDQSVGSRDSKAQDSDVDFDVPSDVELLDNEADSEARPVDIFGLDLRRFLARNVKYADGSIFLDVPVEDRSTVIRLPAAEVKKCHKLMGQAEWTHLRRNWETKLWKQPPLTEVSRIMIHYLRKLENFCKVCPRGDRAEEQDVFLQKYTDFLEYCICMVERGIESIRDRLSPSTTRSESDEAEKRVATSTDLIKILIPSLVHVLEAAWTLGGDDQSDTKFTSSSTTLLNRLCGWIGKLYRPLLLLEEGVNDEEAVPRRAQTEKRKEIHARKQLESPLVMLENTLMQAPERLKRAEDEDKHQEMMRRWRLKRQEEEKLKWAIEEERRAEYIKQQNTLVARHLREKANKPSSTNRSYTVPAQRSPSASTSFPPVWTEEERANLSAKLEAAFHRLSPRLPDDLTQLLPLLELPSLQDTAALVGHDETQTMTRSRDMLKEILERHYPDARGRDVQKWIHQVVRQWR
jgi:hypothetical protein